MLLHNLTGKWTFNGGIIQPEAEKATYLKVGAD